MEKILPILIMLESFVAALIYVYYGKYGRALYWCSGGLLILSVVFLIKR
jgi:hypothetical protein